MHISYHKCYDVLHEPKNISNLCKILAKRYELQEMNNIYIKEKVTMFIEVVSQNKVMLVL